LDEGASQPSQDAQNTPQTAQLREFLDELAARVAAIEAARDRQARVRDLLDDAGFPPEPARGPHHAAPRRDRPDWLRVIPGGLAALVPAPGHGAAALLPVTAQVWLSRRNWPRWAVAAVALGLAGASAMPTAADVRAAPAHHAPAADCHAPREYHPNPPDGDSDDKVVVARLPLAGCPAAGEGGGQPLAWHPRG